MSVVALNKMRSLITWTTCKLLSFSVSNIGKIRSPSINIASSLVVGKRESASAVDVLCRVS